jgi:hypothetical protein
MQEVRKMRLVGWQQATVLRLITDRSGLNKPAALVAISSRKSKGTHVKMG